MTSASTAEDTAAARTSVGGPTRLHVWLQRPTLVAWVIATACWALYLALAEHRDLAFDGQFYWTLSDGFDPAFDVTDHSDGLRGYAFPLLLRLARELARPLSDDPAVVVRLLGLALVPALLCVLVPAIAARLSPRCAVTVPRLLLLNALFFLSWRLDLLHPLSDIPALTAMAVGVWLTLRSRSPVVAGLAGVAWGVAMNMRPAYLAAVLVALATLALVEREGRRLAARSLGAVLGIALALLPQVAANIEHHDTASPVPVDSSNLTRLQLFQGVQLVRYETYVGDDPRYPAGLRFQHDELSAVARRDGEFESIGAYLAFVADNPTQVATVYVLHAVNGVDTRFGGTYVEVLDRGVSLASVLNYAVLVIAAASLLAHRARGPGIVWRSPVTWYSVVLLAACGPAIVGAVEPRFLLPLHLTLGASFALCVKVSDLPSTARGRIAALAALIVLVAGLEAASAASLDRLPELPNPTPASRLEPALRLS